MLDRPLAEIIAALRRGEVTSVALAEAAIERHARHGAALNAYRTFAPELARAAARAADAAFAAGLDLGPLQGIPVSVKDLYGMADLPVYAGTPRRLPARWEADGPVVARLRQQLAVVTGKSHTVEFALGGLGTNRHWGAPWNPWDADDHRVPGGSSSGAGVSLQEGSALVALGSDTTGSVRMPASWTGTVGLMVSHGRWSTEGIVPVAPVLDAPGLLTRSVADLVPSFLALDGPPELASTDAVDLGGRDLRGVRLGVAERFFWADCSPGIAEGVRAALTELEAAGAVLVDLPMPEPEPVYEMFQQGHLSTAAVYGMIRGEFPEWWGTLDPNVRLRLEQHGANLSAHEYVARLRRIEGWMRAADARLAEVDALVLPTISVTPAKVADLAQPDAYRTHNLAASRNCAVLALYGVSAITLPVALDAAGMPVGLQLAARHNQDRALLALALAAERRLGTADRRIGRPTLPRA
jgi:aspartyl-tRNA(Asn)/glutamyl-tRNA(Gln) amidotransferase subunit A